MKEVIKILPTKERSPESVGFSAEFYEKFKEDFILILAKQFHKIESEGILLNAFYETLIILIPKPYKDPTERTSDQFHL